LAEQVTEALTGIGDGHPRLLLECGADEHHPGKEEDGPCQYHELVLTQICRQIESVSTASYYGTMQDAVRLSELRRIQHAVIGSTGASRNKFTDLLADLLSLPGVLLRDEQFANHHRKDGVSSTTEEYHALNPLSPHTTHTSLEPLVLPRTHSPNPLLIIDQEDADCTEAKGKHKSEAASHILRRSSP
jgi:hypothetical protein